MSEVVIKRGEYNGKPTIELYRHAGDKYPFSFGYGKAKLIQDALDKDPQFLKKYVEESKS